VTDAPLLEVDDLAVRFGAVTAVSSVSFTVSKGRSLRSRWRVGRRASPRPPEGIIGLLPPHASMSGSVRFKGDELVGASRSKLRKVRGSEIGYVFQDALTALDPVRTVGAQLTEALQIHRPGHEEGGPQDRGGPPRRGSDRRPRSNTPVISASALGRHAATCGDRRRADRRPRAHHRRRADFGSRCHCPEDGCSICC
jgi:ABC-type dipeptide/oligopeptide/nickel transport system ATPase component